MKKFFMVLAVAGLMTFTAKYASAQEDTTGAATEEVVSAVKNSFPETSNLT